MGQFLDEQIALSLQHKADVSITFPSQIAGLGNEEKISTVPQLCKSLRLAAITFYVDVTEIIFIFQPSLLNLMKEINELASFKMPFSSSPEQTSLCYHPAFICMTPKPT